MSQKDNAGHAGHSRIEAQAADAVSVGRGQNGVRRLERLEANAVLTLADRDSIGCLVLDARMPGMTGVDLLRHLAATGSRIPVIMLTARGDDETRWRSLEAKDLAST